MTQPALPGLAEPFEAGQLVQWHPDRARPGFTLDRAYRVTSVIDEGARWAVYATQTKAKGGTIPRIMTRWPKDHPEACRVILTNQTGAP